MSIAVIDSRIKLEGFLSENELKELQNSLNEQRDEQKIIDLSECDDLHTAIIQLLCAYKITNGCEFIFSGDSAYRKALEGCCISEEYSS